ncbi:MAG: hypothetical protein JRH11_01455 [Deltaproteobacteria bacterium]|nr:hypothetical protein [Deltaproteobacteria bacterium]
MKYATLLLTSLLVLTWACDAPAPGTGRSSMETGSLDVDSTDGPVAGELAGVALEVQDVYFRAFRHEGQERVDLVFAEAQQDDCGLPLPRDGRRVFVRFVGVTELSEGSVTIDRDGEGDVSMHYEQQIDGKWVGVGVGVGRLEFDEVAGSAIQGRVHLCFDDGAESCIAGAFTARACLSRLDGKLPREGTGLSNPPSADEAAR